MFRFRQVVVTFTGVQNEQYEQYPMLELGIKVHWVQLWPMWRVFEKSVHVRQ